MLEVKKPEKPVNKIQPKVTKPRHDSIDDLFDAIYEEIYFEGTSRSQATTLPISSINSQSKSPSASSSTQIPDLTPVYSEFTMESSTFNLEDEIKETEPKKIKLSKDNKSVLPGIFNENAFKSLQSLSNFFNPSAPMPVPEKTSEPKHNKTKPSCSKVFAGQSTSVF